MKIKMVKNDFGKHKCIREIITHYSYLLINIFKLLSNRNEKTMLIN